MKRIRSLAIVMAMLLGMAACGAQEALPTEGSLSSLSTTATAVTAVPTPVLTQTATPTAQPAATASPSAPPETLLEMGGFIPPPEIAKENGTPARLTEADKHFTFAGCEFWLGMTMEDVVARADAKDMTLEGPKTGMGDEPDVFYRLWLGEDTIWIAFDEQDNLAYVSGLFFTARGYNSRVNNTQEHFYSLYGGPDEFNLTGYKGLQINLHYHGGGLIYALDSNYGPNGFHSIKIYFDDFFVHDMAGLSEFSLDDRLGFRVSHVDGLPMYDINILSDESELYNFSNYLSENNGTYQIIQKNYLKWVVLQDIQIIGAISLAENGIIVHIYSCGNGTTTGRGLSIGDGEKQIFDIYGSNYTFRELGDPENRCYIYDHGKYSLEIQTTDEMVSKFSLYKE